MKSGSPLSFSAERRASVRQSMRLSSLEGVLAMPLVYTGQPANLVMATLLVEGLKLPPGAYGFVVSLPFWCNMLQLPLTPWLGRHLSMRQLFVGSIWAHIGCWAAFAGILLGAPEWSLRHAVPLAAVCVFSAGMVASIMGVAWTAWMQAWVPDKIRGAYFGRRNRFAQISSVVFLLGAGWVMMHPRLEVLAGLILFSCAMRAASAVVASRTPAQGDPVAEDKPSWAKQWQSLRTNKPFLRSVVFVGAWSAVLNGFGAFQPVFMLAELADSVAWVSLPLALALLFGALALPAWGKLLDRYGARPVLMCAVGLWAVVGLPWAFMTRETQVLLYAVWALSGAVNAGIVIGQLNLLMKLIPRESKALAVGLNIAAGSVGTAVAPILSGQLLEFLLARGWSAVEAYHAFFWGMAPATVVVLLLLRRVQEPRAAPVEHVLGALRNVRTLGAALGLGFLSQTLFAPRRTK